MKIPFCGGAYEASYIDANNQKCINMFPITAGPMGRGSASPDGKDTYILIPTCGLQLLTTLGVGPIRGIFTFGSYTYAISGNTVYRLEINTGTETAVVTTLGTLTTSVGVVSAAANPTQVIFVDGTSTGYLYTPNTGVWGAISDPDFPGAGQVKFMDGYFVINKPNTGQFYVSALNNGNDWDPLDVATAESSTDNILGLGLAKGELWILGADSAEIWYNAANASGMPLSNRVGLNINIGCGAPSSIIQINDLLVWLDNRGYIVQSDISPFTRNNNTGYQLTIISNEAITSEILSYSRRDDAIATVYNDRGHLMYQLTFPTVQKTWVRDFTTNQWHQRTYYDTFTNSHKAHLGYYSASSGVLTVMGGERNGDIYISKSNVYTDNGAAIHRIRTSPILNDEFTKKTVSRLYFRLTSGVVPAGVVPSMMLRYSHNGGHTWSNEISQEMGRTGEFAKDITYNRLGIGKEWIIETRIADPINFSIIDCTADITG
jgi:hypothetical protein